MYLCTIAMPSANHHLMIANSTIFFWDTFSVTYVYTLRYPAVQLVAWKCLSSDHFRFHPFHGFMIVIQCLILSLIPSSGHIPLFYAGVATCLIRLMISCAAPRNAVQRPCSSCTLPSNTLDRCWNMKLNLYLPGNEGRQRMVVPFLWDVACWLLCMTQRTACVCAGIRGGIFPKLLSSRKVWFLPAIEACSEFVSLLALCLFLPFSEYIHPFINTV